MILITGLGPGDIARIPGPVLDLLLDESKQLILRTEKHPAARQISELRAVTFCDDLYESSERFEDVYAAIADRVIRASSNGPVIYAVPGGPTLGEFAVRQIVDRGREVEVLGAETFVDAILAEVGYDPLDRGMQILNGHDLPFPLLIDKPTIIGHLDRPEVLADVAASISRVLPEGAVVTVFSGVGSTDSKRVDSAIDQVDPGLAGFSTSLWVDTDPGGIVGAIRTMRRLRLECPWDREQTHSTLAKNLVEESYELIDAFDDVESDPSDLVAYARVEEEVGDVLLQVLFHAAIAQQRGIFDINDAAEVLRQKLVRRHPHVFSDVEVADAAEVKANWDEIKRSEKVKPDDSVLDGIPSGMPALYRASKMLNRANKSGFSLGEDRELAEQVQSDLVGLLSDEHDPAARFGDLLLGLVDLARRSGLDPEQVLRASLDRFESQFREREHRR